MKSIAFALALALSLPVAGVAIAHPEDEGFRQAATREQVKAVAKTAIDTMVLRKVIEPSWNDLEPVSATTRTANGYTEWVVIFENPKATDSAKRKVYVFTNVYGDYLAANHTGE